MEHTTVPAYAERIVFTDGDHVTLTVPDPGYVTARGTIAGESFNVDLRADLADENAHLLLNGNTPDALWNLPRADAARLGNAMIGAAGAARLAIPDADGPEDLPAPTPRGNAGADAADILEAEQGDGSERIALDGGHADVDQTDQHVELSIRFGDRACAGIALSAGEAARIGAALTAAAHRAHVQQAAQIDLGDAPTVTDLHSIAQASGIPAAALVEAVTR